MQCPKCGGQNPDDAYFCGACGVQLRSNFAASGPVDIGGGTTAFGTGDLAGSELDPNAGMPAENANPFTDSEPTARRAFEDSFTAPQPQPAPAPQPPPAYAPPPAGGYAPPPGTYGPPAAAGYGAPPGYQAGGNTSGMGDGYPVPPEASGWTFAGFLPFGLFSFNNGNTQMGIVGIVGSLISVVGLVYAIMIGVNGKENAWRNRRFDSVQQYVETMRAWNNWGIGLLLAGVAFFVLYMIVVFAIIGAGIASGELK